MPEIADLTEDTTPDQTDIVYATDAAGTVDKEVPIWALGAELGYAESRSLFTFASNSTWVDVTALSFTMTAPSVPYFLRAEATATVTHVDKVRLFLRIFDVGTTTEVARGHGTLIDHLGTAAGAGETFDLQVSAQVRVTGVTAGTAKTYKVQALQISDGTTPTVGLMGDTGSDKNAHWLRAWMAT